MPRLELLIGMIASGKSTYALKRAEEGALVVSHDALTAMLHAEYRYESGLRDAYRRMEEEIAHIAIVHEKDVVIDRTHLTRASRERWVEFANRFLPTVPVIAVAFPIEPAHIHATRRFAHDARGRTFLDWHGVALHHAVQAQAEPLSDDEGFAEIRHVNKQGELHA
jgi:predicted kinase